MAINLVKGEIKIILETLTEQLNTINQHPGKIPQIEVDIILANIRRLYERFYDLNELNNKPVVIKADEPIPAVIEEMVEEKPELKAEVKEPETEMKQVVPEPVPEKMIIVQEHVDNKVKESPKEAMKDIPTESPAEPPATIIFEEKAESPKEEKPKPAEPVKKQKSEKPKSADLFSLNDKEILADKFKETPKSSVHDKISVEKNEKTVAEKIGKSSIPSLKSAIGINDKFLFINQLFKGDLQGYNKAIDKLNSCTTIEQATSALEDLKSTYGWDNGDEAYQKLEDLVIRKLL